MTAIEPASDLLGRTWFRLESGDAIGDALVVDGSNRIRIANMSSPCGEVHAVDIHEFSLLPNYQSVLPAGMILACAVKRVRGKMHQ